VLYQQKVVVKVGTELGERPIQGLTPMSSVLRFAWSSQPIAMLMLFMLWCWTGTVGEGRSMLIKWHAIYCGSCRTNIPVSNYSMHIGGGKDGEAAKSMYIISLPNLWCNCHI